MSKEAFEWFDNLEEFEPIHYDRSEELRADYERLCSAVDAGDLTPQEANDIYEQFKEIYGIN